VACIQVAAEGGKSFQFTELGHVQTQGTGHLFHGLDLGGTADAGNRQTDVDGRADTGEKQPGSR
jgi:hypothetical protein